jgi:hypothetical protein
MVAWLSNLRFRLWGAPITQWAMLTGTQATGRATHRGKTKCGPCLSSLRVGHGANITPSRKNLLLRNYGEGQDSHRAVERVKKKKSHMKESLHYTDIHQAFFGTILSLFYIPSALELPYWSPPKLPMVDISYCLMSHTSLNTKSFAT